MNKNAVVRATQSWLDQIVIGENLCPFAQRERQHDRILISVTEACDTQQLLIELEARLQQLQADPRIETTLLVHPYVLREFDEYNQFLDIADELLQLMDLVGTIQIASFHPAYQFQGTDADAAENFTNRSPYPMLHLLREDSVARAIASFPEIDQVPERNIQRMQQITTPVLQKILADLSA